MINHIDVSTVLRATVCDLYSNLVTRPTGAAVRAEIEQQLAELGGRTLTVIDFSQVGLLDFSCADEIVAKLLLKYCESATGAAGHDGAPGPEGYFVFRGIHDAHLDAIEAVLEHHGLALVAERAAGEAELVGIVADTERRAWNTVRQLGGATAEDLAAAGGMPLDDAERVLDTLRRRRLLMRVQDAYVLVGAPR
jgi:hypothetical protein